MKTQEQTPEIDEELQAKVQNLIREKRIEEVEDILNQTIIAETPVSQILALLRGTQQIKRSSPQRILFFADVEEVLGEKINLAGLRSETTSTKDLSEAWGIVFALEGQEPWEKAQQWLRNHYQFRPRRIVGAELFKPTQPQNA